VLSRERSGIADAEGATAPESLRQKDRESCSDFWREALKAKVQMVTVRSRSSRSHSAKEWLHITQSHHIGVFVLLR
jgi:hypothetical protein